MSGGGGFGGGASFGFNSQGSHAVMTRMDAPEYSEVLTETNADFPVILGGDYTYLLSFDQETPSQILIATDGLER